MLLFFLFFSLVSYIRIPKILTNPSWHLTPPRLNTQHTVFFFRFGYCFLFVFDMFSFNVFLSPPLTVFHITFNIQNLNGFVYLLSTGSRCHGQLVAVYLFRFHGRPGCLFRHESDSWCPLRVSQKRSTAFSVCFQCRFHIFIRIKNGESPWIVPFACFSS